jgi:hypothetical protein
MRRRLQARPVSAAVAVCILAASAGMPSGHAKAAERVREQPPTAEEARLRAACAAAGEQILAGNLIRSAVYQEQFSRYSAQANRCYVEMRVQTMPEENADRIGRYLYDGQTKELLAFAQIKEGKKSGRVFDLNHRTQSFENAGFDDASEYIYAMMAGDP